MPGPSITCSQNSRSRPMTCFGWRHDIRPCSAAAACGFSVGLLTCCHGVNKVLVNHSRNGNLTLSHLPHNESSDNELLKRSFTQHSYQTHTSSVWKSLSLWLSLVKSAQCRWVSSDCASRCNGDSFGTLVRLPLLFFATKDPQRS